MVRLVERAICLYRFRSCLYYTGMFFDHMGNIPFTGFATNCITSLGSSFILGNILIDGRHLLQLSWLLPMYSQSTVGTYTKDRPRCVSSLTKRSQYEKSGCIKARWALSHYETASGKRANKNLLEVSGAMTDDTHDFFDHPVR